MKKRTNYILYILFISCLIGGCKSPQKLTESSYTRQAEQVNTAISFLENQSWQELINQYITTNSEELLNATISKIVYDTQKPIDPNTGNHPVAERIDIDITGEKKAGTKEGITGDTRVTIDTALADQSVRKSDNAASNDTKKTILPVNWQLVVILILAFVCAIILLIKAAKR